MIDFVFGHSRSAKRSYILNKIRSEIDSQRKVLLIAPEQQALMWDSLVASELPPTAALQVETLSFTRLADTVFRRMGGCSKNYINNAKKTLIMWRALVSVKDRLRIYNKGREDRYVPILLKAVSEALLYSQTPATLMEASEALNSQGREEGIANKLHDLSIVWAAYDTLLHEKYDDPEEIPDAICELLDGENLFSNHHIIIDSFYTLTPKERNIVRRLFRDAHGVTVTFAIKGSDRDGAHTAHIRAFKNSLALTAQRVGREVRAFNLPEAKVPECISYLKDNLWEYTAPSFEGESNAVRLYTCGDRHDEASVCSAVIWELVEGGASFSEIAIVAADVEKLRGITDVHLEAMGIPVYMSRKSMLSAQGAVRLIISALKVAAYGWRREDVVSCAKTSLTGLTPEEADAFEKYADKWRLRGKKAFCCEGWNMNPDGYTDKLSSWGTQLLMLANNAREKLITPIQELSTHLNGTVREASEAVYKLLCDYNVYSQISKKAELLRRGGKGAEAQEQEQVWASVCLILDTLVEASGDSTTDPVRFSHLVERVAAETEIGTIPDSIDRVVISGAGGARLDGVKHMIILGACEGEFPAIPGDNGFFTQRDKDVLGPMGIELSPGMESRRSEELFRFWAAVTAPSDTLSIIMPQSGDEGTLRPSSGSLRVMALIKNARIKKDAHLDMSFIIRNKAAARYHLPALRNTEAGIALESILGKETGCLDSIVSSGESVSKETADMIFGLDMRLSQSKLESFKNCPQAYYLQYVLNLDEGEQAKISPADVGNFVHKILEDFLREVRDKGIQFPLDKEWSQETVRILIDKYINAVSPENASQRLRYLFARVTRSLKLYIDSLDAEFTESAFEPYEFEMRVGMGGDVPALEMTLEDGSIMSMIGVVDRLDVYRSGNEVYVRVVDYKTGKKQFKLDEVLTGRNVQLLLYLFSVCGCPPCSFRDKLAPNGEKLIPAGAVYFSARPGEVSNTSPVGSDEARKLVLGNIARKGIILRDEGIIRAMEPMGEGRFIPVKFNKDGSISKNSSTADRDEMEAIREELCLAIKETGEKMKSGTAEATVLDEDGESHCEYCKMRPVCRQRI
ncbi:MAG: PD-(D/E)XK nuclease family protein [Clostridia bacterium]|nr:PD-(D/E)XK nuclease family protein [Clostridia bacterium]